MHYLYCITNKENDKKYVGFTSTTPKKRWYQHCKKAFKENKKSKLYSAMRKYGREAFIVEEIYYGEDALDREDDYINEYNAEYNMTKGGSANRLGTTWNHSEESKLKMRKPRGPRTEEHNRKQSESHKGQVPWNKGKEIVKDPSYHTQYMREYRKRNK